MKDTIDTHNCNAFHPSSESNFGSGLALETRARRDTEARMVSVMFNPKSISLLPVQRRAKARGQRKHEAASNVEVSGKAWGNVSNVPLADFLQVQVHGHMTNFSFSTYSSSQGLRDLHSLVLLLNHLDSGCSDKEKAETAHYIHPC